MGKNTRGEKEFTKEQELKHENKELRKRIIQLEAENRQLTRQYSRTRKNFARMDLDRHSYVQDIIQEHINNEKEETTSQQMLNAMKKEWQCHECEQGYLEIFLYNRRDGTFYHRMCSNPSCDHRTGGQKYDPETVKGIVKKPKTKPKNGKKF